MQEFVEAAVPGRGYTLTILRERRTIAVKVVLSQLPPIQGGTPEEAVKWAAGELKNIYG